MNPAIRLKSRILPRNRSAELRLGAAQALDRAGLELGAPSRLSGSPRVRIRGVLSHLRILVRRTTTSCILGAMLEGSIHAAVRQENFDREPSNWEGINHRGKFFEPKTVSQDFGHTPASSRAGGQPGEIGGRINPAAEAAWYGYALPRPLTFDSPMTAEGRLYTAPGAGHCLVGFFNTNTLDGWRTPNTIVARINNRGDTFHCHLEYCTSRWRAGAGVIGEIVPGERLSPKLIPSGKPCTWKLDYDPNGAGGRGLLTFTLNGASARCEILPDHRREGVTVTHFGLLPVMKAWDSLGEIWLDDVTINGVAFDFGKDPNWAAFNNRRTYVTTNVRPRFDFGWSPTHYAGGKLAGELGGLIFRGDCREPHRMASYGDRLETLSLKTSLEARGKVCMLRGVSDSTASIGFYHSTFSMRTNSSQKHSVPMDYLGINIEGPSAEGFFFYPVYRTHGEAEKAMGANNGRAPRIYPDGRTHDWFLRYDPSGANGKGQITVGLDEQTCRLDLGSDDNDLGATFDRFGICTPWIDGNSVTVYFDDLTYTCSP